jgi:hypothetical protein
MALKLSTNLFKALIRIIQTVPLDDITKKSYIDRFKGHSEDLVKKRVNDTNYSVYLQKVYTDIYNIGEKYKARAISHYLNNSTQLYKMYNKAGKRFENLFCKYDDLQKFNYEHVVDITNEQITVSPIFIDKLFENIENSKYHLFMSATINDYYIKKTFSLDENDIKFIKVKPIFPKESKRVVFINHDSYNYKTLKK